MSKGGGAIRWSEEQLAAHQKRLASGPVLPDRPLVAPPRKEPLALVVMLPFPSSKLNPNRSKGLHWGATSALRKSARSEAWAATREAASKTEWFDTERTRESTVALTITFIQPDRRHRDRDNLLAALKPALDGMADALEINDAQFDPVTIRRAYGDKPGAVRIEIGAQS